MVNVHGRLKFMYVALLFVVMLFSVYACSSRKDAEVDHLNHLSYINHYRNLDTAEAYARKALSLSNDYSDGKAEAYNNLAFVSICRMQYALAGNQLDSVRMFTDNQIELLIADVQNMRLCQRKSDNKVFYDFHGKATERIKSIKEAVKSLDENDINRFLYAETEFYIVTSTYYYYVGLEAQSAKAMDCINPDGGIERDTAQYLNYLYSIGSGGVISTGAKSSIGRKEMEYLLHCYSLAKRGGYLYWEANSMQAMSEHLLERRYRDELMDDFAVPLEYINEDNMPDSLLAGNFAQRSLDMFTTFGDVYQVAGAYRTLAQCYMSISDFPSALICLDDALSADTAINQTPDLVASIREQLSVAYSAIDDKPHSDFNRNIYLDLQEQTRQDRYLEARAEQLRKSSAMLNTMLVAVIFLILCVVFLLFLFNRLQCKKCNGETLETLLQPLMKWKKDKKIHDREIKERHDELRHKIAVQMAMIEKGRKKIVEQRAKMSFVIAVTPIIDRIINEVNRACRVEGSTVKADGVVYIRELTELIDQYNKVLTEWIQLRRGELSLKVESFPLARIFSIVQMNNVSFSMKGVAFEIGETTDVVKADKALTLFMINTMTDNARKFTPCGGRVKLYSVSTEDYVEINIEDNGCGMTESQAANVFNRSSLLDGNTHGFGLLNCKGIIEKYRKVSRIFSVCTIGVDSHEGNGSRFFFRLPKGVVRTVLTLILFLFNIACWAGMGDVAKYDIIKARQYSDSAYTANVNGRYADCLTFADSCLVYMNSAYTKIVPEGMDFLTIRPGASRVPAEMKWWHDRLPLDYTTILEIRNETAVAALALHDWELYKYNNNVYIQLYKDISADDTLSSYCQTMQDSENNKTVSIILLILLLLILFPAYYLMYYRHVLYYRFCLEKVKGINDVLVLYGTDSERLEKIEAVDISDFPQALKDVVRQIDNELRSSLSMEIHSNDTIETANDQLNKYSYEAGRLHVVNNVLDNCLSTLKHETMYYPSRIRQLLENDGSDMTAISDVAHYYRGLYGILTLQAVRQLSRVGLICQPVDVNELLSGDNCTGCRGAKVLGDKTSLTELFHIIRKKSSLKALDVDVFCTDNGYVRFKIRTNLLKNEDSPLPDIFAPKTENIPYFVCRQIVRDNGEASNHRACGMEIVGDYDGNVYIVVFLTAFK